MVALHVVGCPWPLVATQLGRGLFRRASCGIESAKGHLVAVIPRSRPGSSGWDG